MEVKMILVAVCAVILLCVIFFFGMLVGMRRKQKYDGTLWIGTVEDRDQFQFIFDTELEDLVKQSVLVMKIEHSQNQQPV